MSAFTGYLVQHSTLLLQFLCIGPHGQEKEYGTRSFCACAHGTKGSPFEAYRKLLMQIFPNKERFKPTKLLGFLWFERFESTYEYFEYNNDDGCKVLMTTLSTTTTIVNVIKCVKKLKVYCLFSDVILL